MKTKQKRDRRARLLRKNGSRCYLCHETFLANQLTLDHLKPSSRGGSNKLENLRLACFPCNNRRSNRLERSHPSLAWRNDPSCCTAEMPTEISTHLRSNSIEL